MPDLPEAPYPPTTNVGASSFPLDVGRIEQSDTWNQAPAELRPWVLMIWAKSWRQIPSGSWPSDHASIAAHVGMSKQQFASLREVLLRGWYKAADGRLYHPVISELVLQRLAEREAWRHRQGLRRHSGVTQESPGSHAGHKNVTRESRAGGGGKALSIEKGFKSGRSGGPDLSTSVTRDSLEDLKVKPASQKPNIRSRSKPSAAAPAAKPAPRSKGNGAETWSQSDNAILAKARELGVTFAHGATYAQIATLCRQALKGIP